MRTMTAPQNGPNPGSRALAPHMVAAAVLSAALVAFIFQNSRRTRVHWLVFSANLPLWLLLVITSAIAVTATELVAITLRRRGRDDS
jgi:uncharacterized integral membrane protein